VSKAIPIGERAVHSVSGGAGDDQLAPWFFMSHCRAVVHVHGEAVIS